MLPASKKTIVLVEDDQFLSSMYAERLGMEGFHVKTAADGAAGLKLVSEAPPDLVLLDILLPEMDGLTVLKRLRGNAATAKTPVIMLTNLSQPEEIKQATDLGAIDYLVKAHFIPSEVVEKVKAVFAHT